MFNPAGHTATRYAEADAQGDPEEEMRPIRTILLTAVGASVCVALCLSAQSAAAAGSVEKLEYQRWALSGTFSDKRAGQAITLPPGATFTGSGELNNETGAGSLTGSVSVPPFSVPLKLFGLLPVTFGMTLTQERPFEASLASAGAGKEQLTGSVKLNLAIASVSLLGLTIPTRCAVSEPLLLGAVETLSSEELRSSGWKLSATATMPSFRCQGGFLNFLFGLVLSDVLSGPENQYSLATTPTATTTTTSTTSTSTTNSTTTATTTTSTTTTSGGPEVLYVANADTGPVNGYRASSSGAVAPIREASNPQDQNTIWDPWGVAIDSGGNIYVQTFLSDATTFVFGPNPLAGVAPIRIFRAYGPDSRAIAVDNEGYEYVASGEAGSLIAVAPPGAAGTAGGLYSVEPVRTFASGEATFNPWPNILATGGHNLFVATANSAGNAIEAYEGGAGGRSTPVGVLSGGATALGACATTCDHVSIAFSSSSSDLYAAVSGGGQEAHISVFGSSASGNAAPLRTIEGSATGLDGKVITGITVSRATGAIYVMVKAAEFEASGQVEVFGAGASGNATPTQAFTDAKGAFADAMGIALGSE
jgi:hypothetical protein